MSQSQNQNNCLKDKEDYIIVPNSKITTSFYRKTFGLLERCHHKTLLLQLLVTRCSVQPPGCLHSTPGMLLPIGQKLLDKNNFKLLIKYVSLLVSRGGGDNPSSSANRLAGNWFYQFHSQHNHALGKSIVFHFKWVWKNLLKKWAVQSLAGEKLQKGMKPPTELALFLNVE